MNIKDRIEQKQKDINAVEAEINDKRRLYEDLVLERVYLEAELSGFVVGAIAAYAGKPEQRFIITRFERNASIDRHYCFGEKYKEPNAREEYLGQIDGLNII